MSKLAAVPRFLTPLALLAAVLALALPSGAVAHRSDVLLAVLVLATALGIPAVELARLRAQATAVALLSVLPFLVLGAIGWALGRAFGAGEVRDGLVSCGLSSSEVAAVGLVALAGADAAIALGAVMGSLIVAAVFGPLAIAWLGGGVHVDGGALLGRFALVVLAPLAAGVGLRTVIPALGAVDEQREGVAAVAVVALVYASLSGERGAHRLGLAIGAGAAFLACSAMVAAAWRSRVSGRAGTAGAFAIGMRDFAVAAALATQAFGPAAGVVPGVYGVLMLIAGSAAAGRLRSVGRTSEAHQVCSGPAQISGSDGP